MQTPHDTLFAFTFGHPLHAAAWLRCVLPTVLVAATDWTTLLPIRERFPGVRLRPHLVDVGFAARLAPAGGEGIVLLLLEHKSYADPEVSEQLLRYSIHLRRALQQRSGQAPFVLPVLLRHGFAGPAADVGNHAPSTELPAAELLAAQPRQTIFVDDLDARSEAEITARAQSPLATLTQLCLKVLRRATPEQVADCFDRWQHLLRAVDRTAAPPDTPPLGCDAIDAIGWYALAVTEVDSLVLADTFSRILQRTDITIMSTLERTFQKGLAEGLAKGLAKGKAETLLLLLSHRFGPLDETVTARIRAASLDELGRWTGRALVASTLTEVFDVRALG